MQSSKVSSIDPGGQQLWSPFGLIEQGSCHPIAEHKFVGQLAAKRHFLKFYFIFFIIFHFFNYHTDLQQPRNHDNSEYQNNLSPDNSNSYLQNTLQTALLEPSTKNLKQVGKLLG